MGPVRCEVHQLRMVDPNKKVVRIRANAFQAFQGKKVVRISRISNKQPSKSAYFEATYADDAYMNSRNLINDLVFMGERCREQLKDERLKGERSEDLRVGDSVDLEEIQGKALLSLYAVHQALSDDSNEGRIWIKPSSQNTELGNIKQGERRIVRIKRKDAKPVFSEALLADPGYLKRWEETRKVKGSELEDCNVIFISAWYRHSLGIEEEKFPVIIDLDDVKLLHPGSPRNLWALLYQYPRNHPQALVRSASMMGIIGFGLGVIGTGLGVVGINDWLASHISPSLTNFSTPFGFVLCVVVLAIAFFFGIMGLIRR